MSTEYERILQLLMQEEGGDKLPIEELMKLVLDFTDRYQALMKTGTDNEKAKIQEQMDEVKAKIQEQAEKKQEQIQLTQEELQAMGRDPKNFTKEQWKILERARQEIEQHRAQRQPEPPPEKKPPRKSDRKSKWLKG